MIVNNTNTKLVNTSTIYNCVVSDAQSPVNPTEQTFYITEIQEQENAYTPQYPLTLSQSCSNSTCYFSNTQNPCNYALVDYTTIYMYVYWNADGKGFKNYPIAYSYVPPMVGVVYATSIGGQPSFITIPGFDENTLLVEITQNNVFVNVCVIIPNNCGCFPVDCAASIRITSTQGSIRSIIYNCVVDASQCPVDPSTTPFNIKSINPQLFTLSKNSEIKLEQNCSNYQCFFSYNNCTFSNVSVANYTTYLYVYWNACCGGFKTTPIAYSCVPPTVGINNIYTNLLANQPPSFLKVDFFGDNALNVNYYMLAYVNVVVLFPESCKGESQTAEINFYNQTIYEQDNSLILCYVDCGNNSRNCPVYPTESPFTIVYLNSEVISVGGNSKETKEIRCA